MRQWSAIRTLTMGLAALAMAGCGGSSNANKTVAQVTLSPATLSMVAGEVFTVTSGALNASGSAVSPVPNITISTSNPRLVTVSPKQEVCGGVWDSTFVVCNGLDSSGNPLSGSATLTATANGVSSGPLTVSVHPPVTSIAINPDPVPGCFSNKQTVQFTGTACSTAVTPHAASGPCSPNAADITDKVGAISWSSTISTVVSIDANGLATGHTPGIAGIVASVGNTSSPATSFKTCMPTQIVLHVTGDPPGVPTESANLNVNDTKILQADMVDENGTVTLGAPVGIFTNNKEILSFSGVSSSITITGQSPGGAGLLAACVPPVCGAGINQPVYSNLFSVTVNGTSPSTAIYVGSTDSNVVLPFDTSKTPPAAGSPVQLPGNLLSIAFTPDGATGYLATDQGLTSLNTATNAVTTLTTNAVGRILAVSPDGQTVIMTNAPFEVDPTHHRLFVYSSANNTVTTFILPGAIGAAFTGDGSKAYISAGSSPPNPQPQNVYVFSPFLTLQKLAVGGNAVSAATTASGPFAFIANGATSQVINVCDNSLAASAPVATSAPQLLGAFQDADAIVAVNSTGLDIDTMTIGLPTAGFCPPTVTHSNQFIDFGIGAFTARRLLVAPSITSHIIVLPVGINQILAAISGRGPGFIPLATGGTEALDGGLTLDGNTLWVGVAGTNTLDRINLITSADELQLPLTALKKGDGTQAKPNLVGVKPH